MLHLYLLQHVGFKRGYSFPSMTSKICSLDLQKTRKVLSEKIEQLNAAIDDVSAQLRSEETSNGVAVNSDEIEAAT